MNGKRGRPNLRFILFLAAFYVLWTIRAIWFIHVDRSIESSEARVVFSATVKVLLWVLPTVLFVYWVRRERPFDSLGLSAFPKPKTWLICLLAISLFGVLVLAFELNFGNKRLSLGTPSVASIPSRIAFFAVSPFVEEVFFRGFVLKELSKSSRLAISNFVASFLFVAIHLPYWISSGVQPQEIARMSAGIFLFSLFAGCLYFFTKSIWPPTAAHIANNILSSLISAR